MSGLKVGPIAGDLPFGARITGVTMENVHDVEVRREVNRLFEAHGLLVFAEVEPSSQMQVALGEVLGPLRNHAMKAVPQADVGAPATLMELHTDPAGPNLFEVDGRVQRLHALALRRLLRAAALSRRPAAGAGDHLRGRRDRLRRRDPALSGDRPRAARALRRAGHPLSPGPDA